LAKDSQGIEGEEGLIVEQVRAVAVGVIIVIAVLNVSNFYLGNRVSEPFSQLAILGPNKEIGNFPTTLVAGHKFSLYGYVGNHEGTVNYYQVLVKLGNQSTQISNSTYARAAELTSYGQVLANGQSVVFPVGLSLVAPGDNQRIIFELWMLNTTSSQFFYSGLWAQIWVNVTVS
jgi:uncharacterized membrane protein